MKIFLKVILLTAWGSLLLFFHIGLLVEDGTIMTLIFVPLWWLITLPIILFKLKKKNKEKIIISKEESNKWKEFEKKKKYEQSKEYKKLYISDVVIEHPYLGKGILEKDSNNHCFKNIKEGFDIIFSSFNHESVTDLYEIIVSEDEISYVLNSIEKVCKKSKTILENTYFQVVDRGKKLVEDNDFDFEFCKENFLKDIDVTGICIYDDCCELTGILSVKEYQIKEQSALYGWRDAVYFEISINVNFETEEIKADIELQN